MIANPIPNPNTPAHSWLAQLLDAMGAFVFAKNAQARYTYANAPLLARLGCTLEDLLGAEASRFVQADQAQTVASYDERVLRGGETVECEEVFAYRHSGQRRTYWTVRRPLLDSQGNIVGLCGISTDITERKALDDQLQEQRQLLDVVLNTIDAYIYMKDENRRYRYINTKVANNLGIRPEDAVGKLDSEVVPREWADKFWALDRAVFQSGKAQSAEETHVAADGTVLHHWSTKVPIRYEGVPALIGFSTDITEVVRLREQLRQQAITDGLTGLFNRRHFNELTVKELARARRHAHPTALLLLDIDHFKRINDQHGHPMGDAVLERVAALLRSMVRAEDTPARVGGEEFAILLPRTEGTAACQLAERILQALRTDHGILPGGAAITASAGVVVAREGCDRLETLYAAADEQLYRAKAAGRDRVSAAGG